MNAPASLTPTAPTSMLTTVVTMLATKVLMAIAAAMVTHGWINGSGTEMFVAGGLGALAVAWSWIKIFWDNYGKAIVMAQLEVLKAKSMAQAAALKDAGQPKVTVAEIAAQSPTMDAAAVTKAIATLPSDIAANVATGAKVLLVALMLSAMIAPSAFAQPKMPKFVSPFVASAPSPTSIDADIKAKIAEFEQVTIADLTAAKQIFDAAKNTNGSACAAAWLALAQANATIDAAALPDPHLFSFLAKAYNLHVALQSGASLRTACAPLKDDLNNGLLGIGGGAAAVTKLVPALAMFGL